MLRFTLHFGISVRDQLGHEFDLPRINIDSGYILFLDGASVRESHPKFAAYFQHALSEIAQKTNPLINKEELISHWRWLLERKAFDPDEPTRERPHIACFYGSLRWCGLPKSHLDSIDIGFRARRLDRNTVSESIKFLEYECLAADNDFVLSVANPPVFVRAHF